MVAADEHFLRFSAQRTWQRIRRKKDQKIVASSRKLLVKVRQ